MFCGLGGSLLYKTIAEVTYRVTNIELFYTCPFYLCYFLTLLLGRKQKIYVNLLIMHEPNICSSNQFNNSNLVL